MTHDHFSATSFEPCILHLTAVDVLGFDASTNAIGEIMHALPFITTSYFLWVVCVCQLSSSIRSLVLYDFMTEHLDEDTRFSFLSTRMPSELAKFAARNTAGFVIAELINLLKDAHFRMTLLEADRLEISHVEWAIDKRNASFADAIGAPKIPSVSWDDVGGLEETKRTVIESIEASLHGTGIRRSGVIFFGPPGCGKTLIAKGWCSLVSQARI
ncbi:hypothetical protein ANCCEY_09550 [Ancylostoma ceylanicum]|uniref:ATPase AAA-type core domain-containing protein n=1 Tax=Ancylostoma ceylanicum TaxID=53326 RepID=A0A0D6LH27_9BILA|nr:hypothetical protein ANCCEY_09550 [Ancylostoma ceylanicum]